MSPEAPTQDRAPDEAARWFARLNEASVSPTTLEAFYAWRKAPENDAAYRKLERFWDGSGSLIGTAAMSQAVVAARARGRLRGRQRAMGWGLAAAVVAACGLGGLAWFQGGAGTTYATAVGEQRVVTLADGTRIRLDTDTRIAVRLEATRRSVILDRGQALFEVAHLADRPFEVRAGDTMVYDLGTRFDVRRASGSVQITLVEGAVDVTGPGLQATGVDLKPGQQLIVGRDKAQTQPVDPSHVTSWTTGQLIFNDLPLEQATAEINRYAVHKIILAPDGVGAIHVSGAFHTNDADAFAQAIAQLYDLDQRRQRDGTIRINRPITSEVVKKLPDPPG